MERIQSAIEKARAERQRPKGSRRSATSGLASPEARSDGGVWSELRAFVPDGRHLEAQRVVTQGSGQWAAPFDVMRTKLLIQMRNNGWKRLAVTSPGSGCGKTTLTLNLAFSLARQAELRVMVVELDLHRPSMARILHVRPKHSLADVLSGEGEPDILRYGSNLAFVLGSGPLGQSAELLNSPEAAKVLDALQARYQPDIVIFDMPPMLLTDDTIAFIDKVDCAILVGAAEKTTVAEIDVCEQDLAAHTKVVGVVLNKCRYLESSEGYGYGGSY